MIKRIFCVSLVPIFVLLSTTAFAQCSGGYCPPQQPAQVNVRGLSDYVVRVRAEISRHGLSLIFNTNTRWKPLETSLHSTQTAYAYGSGVIFGYDSCVGVLTAAHAVADARSCVIIYRGREIPCSVLFVNTTEDIAILEPQDAAPSLAETSRLPRLSPTPPAVGDTIYLAGYDGNSTPKAWSSRVIELTKARSDLLYGNWFIVTGVARQGDSGGPVFKLAEDGTIIIYGVLWGTDGRTTVFTWLGAIDKKLSELCWRWRQNPGNYGVPPSSPNSPPTSPPAHSEPLPPPQPQPQPQPTKPDPPEPPTKLEPRAVSHGFAYFMIGFFYTLAAAPLILAAYELVKRQR